MTAAEQLTQINTAITAIESGAQEYQIGSRRLKRPDLSVLYQERRQLQQQVMQESAGDTFVAVFDRR
jgi:conjugal transfer/entry exclusion protein